MDFNETLEKMQEATILSPQDILKAKKKEAALKVFKDKKKLRPGEDIMQDPADPSGKKWKVIPNQINKQAITNILTR